jgi:hypothetical protein
MSSRGWNNPTTAVAPSVRFAGNAYDPPNPRYNTNSFTKMVMRNIDRVDWWYASSSLQDDFDQIDARGDWKFDASWEQSKSSTGFLGSAGISTMSGSQDIGLFVQILTVNTTNSFIGTIRRLRLDYKEIA